jgi:hypothetical protein
LGGGKDVTKDDFSAFLKKAVQKETSEHKQLYFYLLKCFQAGDSKKVKEHYSNLYK